MIDTTPKAGAADARRYMRHPVSIPIACRKEGHVKPVEHELRNMSYGGISFVSNEAYVPGDIIDIEFPGLRHRSRIRGEIVWCSPASECKPHQYAHGMKFLDEGDHYHARLIEQICHIELYRRAQELRHGRRMSPQEAAEEWIAKHADGFPR
jgi:hypothetical protein